MSFEVVTTVEPEYVRISVIGEYSFDRLFGFIEHVRSIALETARTKVMIDCQQMTGNMTEAERFQGGQKIAEIFGSRIKAALLMPEGQVTKLGELAAVNRGARFFVTSSEQEVIPWLLA